MSTRDTAGTFCFCPSPKSGDTRRHTPSRPGASRVGEGKDFHCGRGQGWGGEREENTSMLVCERAVRSSPLLSIESGSPSHSVPELKADSFPDVMHVQPSQAVGGDSPAPRMPQDQEVGSFLSLLLFTTPKQFHPLPLNTPYTLKLTPAHYILLLCGSLMSTNCPGALAPARACFLKSHLPPLWSLVQCPSPLSDIISSPPPLTSPRSHPSASHHLPVSFLRAYKSQHHVFFFISTSSSQPRHVQSIIPVYFPLSLYAVEIMLPTLCTLAVF